MIRDESSSSAGRIVARYGAMFQHDASPAKQHRACRSAGQALSECCQLLTIFGPRERMLEP